ncbi:hypothetical protein [uncultured Marinococcus sp.]|nr:hypothetical protein [uncultured Marinococcus sp.]
MRNFIIIATTIAVAATTAKKVAKSKDKNIVTITRPDGYHITHAHIRM